MSKKNKSRHLPQIRRSCIFCGLQTALTEEHVFGDWTKELIPRNRLGWVNTQIEPDYSTGPITVTPKFNNRQGYLGNRTLKVVCAKCNNEWLSTNFDSPVKLCISDMILGKASTVTVSQREIIARWAVKTTMVYELADPQFRGAPASDLSYLRLHTKIPSGWKVWIGKYEGTAQYRAIHAAHLLHDQPVIPTHIMADKKAINAQATMLVIGKLALFVFSGPADQMEDVTIPKYESFLDQIWPINNADIGWPSRLPIDDILASEIVHAPL